MKYKKSIKTMKSIKLNDIVKKRSSFDTRLFKVVMFEGALSLKPLNSKLQLNLISPLSIFWPKDIRILNTVTKGA